MRKFLLCAAFVAACGFAKGQSLTFVPYNDNAFLSAVAISDNGRYVGGGTGEYAFITDMTTLETKYFISEHLLDGDDADDDGETYDATVRSISNDGVGYGYLDSRSTKFDFASGEYTKIDEDTNSLINYTNADGTFQCGVQYPEGFTTHPIVYTDGELKNLPEPTESTLGFEINGINAVSANADGSVIMGEVVDNFATHPLIIWQRNADDSYSVVPVCKRFFNPTYESWQKFDQFNGAAVSQNGKWIALNIHKNQPTWNDPDEGQFIARYDVEADTVQYINCPDCAPDAYIYYYANGIANDGTIIGYVEGDGRRGMICKAGSDTAEYLADVYPSVDALTLMEFNSDCSPCAITSDGRYVAGFGSVDSPLNPESDLFTASWVLDLQGEPTSVSSVASEPKPSKVVATYNLEGKKLGRNNPKNSRLVINRLANGKSVKRVVK